MKWTKFTLDTTTEAVDLISDLLSELGIEGIEISDNIQITEEEKKRLFIDILPELKEDDGIAKVSFYLDSEQDAHALLEQIKEGLNEIAEYVTIGAGTITISETEDKDWINNWKQFFKPFRIDDTLVIKPTWEKLTDCNENDLVIEIDPGTSFGTGSHETTKLCILSIKRHIKNGDIVLDAGSGSGILSIIAKKLGAKEVIGIDIDPMATSAAIENSEVNKLSLSDDKLSFFTGNIIEDEELRKELGTDQFDLVVANILADIIIPLSNVIGENLKPGGIFISSGIINMKEDAVKSALLANKFEILEVNQMGDWVSFTAKKPNENNVLI